MSETPARAVPKSVTNHLALGVDEITFCGLRSRGGRCRGGGRREQAPAPGGSSPPPAQGVRPAWISCLQGAALDVVHRDVVGALELAAVVDADDVRGVPRWRATVLSPHGAGTVFFRLSVCPIRIWNFETEELVAELTLLVLELGHGEKLHYLFCGPMGLYALCAARRSESPAAGSLCEAGRLASAASSGVTPSISNRILPGRTTATEWSGAPLGCPCGSRPAFLVTGLSGNRRSRILPPRLDEARHGHAAGLDLPVGDPAQLRRPLQPYGRWGRRKPRHALPHIRARCCLRYLTFFGINISQSPVASYQLPVISLSAGGHRCTAPFADNWQPATDN